MKGKIGKVTYLFKILATKLLCFLVEFCVMSVNTLEFNSIVN